MSCCDMVCPKRILVHSRPRTEPKKHREKNMLSTKIRKECTKNTCNHESIHADGTYSIWIATISYYNCMRQMVCVNIIYIPTWHSTWHFNWTLWFTYQFSSDLASLSSWGARPRQSGCGRWDQRPSASVGGSHGSAEIAVRTAVRKVGRVGSVLQNQVESFRTR